MQLDELFDRYGIKEISEKTKISEENLRYLEQKDFGALRRVKALGFIAILEREYGVEFEALRAEVKSFFSNGMDVGKSTMIYKKSRSESKKRGFLLKFVAVLALVAIGLMFAKYYNGFEHLQKLLSREEKVSEGTTPTVETPCLGKDRPYPYSTIK